MKKYKLTTNLGLKIMAFVFSGFPVADRGKYRQSGVKHYI